MPSGTRATTAFPGGGISRRQAPRRAGSVHTSIAATLGEARIAHAAPSMPPSEATKFDHTAAAPPTPSYSSSGGIRGIPAPVMTPVPSSLPLSPVGHRGGTKPSSWGGGSPRWSTGLGSPSQLGEIPGMVADSDGTGSSSPTSKRPRVDRREGRTPACSLCSSTSCHLPSFDSFDPEAASPTVRKPLDRTRASAR
eukprot:scaffold1467_cov30-Tisochrysis_lutea.AAC.2